jgi:hypothetical protein
MQSEQPKADSPKRKRRWFQFNLRALFVVVAIVAVQCAVCLPIVREWREQRRIVAELDELMAHYLRIIMRHGAQPINDNATQ